MRLVGFAVALAMLGYSESARAQSQWELVRVDPRESMFQTVAIHPTQPSRIFAAAAHTLYESSDHGETWQPRFRAPATAQMTAVALHPSEPILLVTTDQGVFRSTDAGQHWAGIFRGSGEGEASCTSITIHPLHPEMVVLTTRGGLFISTDRGEHWTKALMPPGARPLVNVAFDPTDSDRLYVVAPHGVWNGSPTNGQWQQRLSLLRDERDPPPPAGEETDDASSGETATSASSLSAMTVDPQQPSTLYLAGSHGLQRSIDSGTTWQQVTRIGLGASAMTRLVALFHSPLAIYAATQRGVARYVPAMDRWTNLAQGLAATRVNDLAATAHELWAATDQGLYHYEIGPDELNESAPPSAQELLGNFVYEPTIAQVRDAAIQYAEVHPNKIRLWRRQAALRALLPTIGLGLDNNRTQDSSVDAGTFPKFQIIDTQDRKNGLNFSVKWELADLIWNGDQTSIDVRSKLMVQLRDDIVDEIIRTYFERRRIQVALLTNPLSDQQTVLEKELRIQELTATIDGLTGGYFSAHTKISDSQP